MVFLIRLAVLISLIGTVSCTGLFFYPSRVLVQTPADAGYAYENIWLQAADGPRLHAWWLPAENTSHGRILFLHGNAENISTHMYSIFWLIDEGYDVLLLDYRGYGRSQGQPDIPEIFYDIDAGFEWLKPERGAANHCTDIALHVFGQSVGASLAITWLGQRSSAEREVNSVIAEAGFTRYADIARHAVRGNWLTWWTQWPVQWFLRSRYDPIDAIDGLAGLPKMIVHSPDDEIIPYAQGRELYRVAAKPKVFVASSGPHIYSAADEDTREKMLDFLKANSGYAELSDNCRHQLSEDRMTP